MAWENAIIITEIYLFGLSLYFVKEIKELKQI